MKKISVTNRIAVFFCIFLVLSFLGCTDDSNETANENFKEINLGIEALTCWGTDKETIKSYMKSFTLAPTKDTNILCFSENANNIIVSFKFESNAMCASTVITNSNMDYSKLANLLNNLSSLGELDGMEVFTNAERGSLAVQSSVVKDNASYDVYGFTPLVVEKKDSVF